MRHVYILFPPLSTTIKHNPNGNTLDTGIFYHQSREAKGIVSQSFSYLETLVHCVSFFPYLDDGEPLLQYSLTLRRGYIVSQAFTHLDDRETGAERYHEAGVHCVSGRLCVRYVWREFLFGASPELLLHIAAEQGQLHRAILQHEWFHLYFVRSK
jgi:hypothetical protein